MRILSQSICFRLLVIFSINLPPIARAVDFHDADGDGDVDARDLASFQLCYNQTTPTCLALHDFDDDNDVDPNDLADFESAMVTPFVPPLPDAPPESAGYPREWEGALPVTPFSVYNLANGNLFTAVPLASWDPVGPPVTFTLYHNNAAAAAETSGADGQGFDLGPGWSTSYSGRVVAAGGSATVIEDDGTQNVFAESDGSYTPPVGVYDKLELVPDPNDPNDPNDNTWHLTRPSQSKRIFNADGLLIAEQDSSGNAVTIARDGNGRINYVASAASELSGVGYNRLTFSYASGLLDEVEDPIGRVWEFAYDGNDALYTITLPHNDVPVTYRDFTYDSVGRLATIVRRDADDPVWSNTWTYSYTSEGRLETVTDPTVTVDEEPVQYPEGFEEGFAEPPATHYPVLSNLAIRDGVGRMVQVSTRGRALYCPIDWDDNDNQTSGGGGDPDADRLGGGPSTGFPAPGRYIGFSRGAPMFNSFGQLLTLDLMLDESEQIGDWPEGGFATDRRYEHEYDELGRVTEIIRTLLPGDIERTFTVVEYNPDGSPLEILGPDGQTTTYTYTDCGELESIYRNGLEATLHYDDARRIDWIDYGNGTGIDYTYDDADRVTQIRHCIGQSDLLVIGYTWTINNWVATRTETDYTVTPSTQAVVTFDYDSRGRLIQETRVVDGSTTTYDLTYTYDQLGNRQTKTDDVAELLTEYTYDVELDPNDPNQWPGYPGTVYPTRNNRLLYYTVSDTSGQEPVLLRTVKYTYYDTGNASNISVKDEYVDAQTTPGDPNDYKWEYDVALGYWAEQTLRVAMWDKWQLDGNGDPNEATYTPTGAREFHYDSARQRYMALDFTVTEPDEPNAWEPNGPIQWTDYLDEQPYADAEITGSGTQQDPWTLSDTVSLMFPGAQEVVGTGEIRYWHGDLIGSTMLTTDATGDPNASVTYSAFGEVLSATGSPGGTASSGFPRYAYAGAWGYESGHLILQGANTDLAPVTLQHVGARWYQPNIGRFVQRDPIGIQGGLNVYGYCLNSPLASVDVTGMGRYLVLRASRFAVFPIRAGETGKLIGISVVTTNVYDIMDDTRQKVGTALAAAGGSIISVGAIIAVGGLLSPLAPGALACIAIHGLIGGLLSTIGGAMAGAGPVKVGELKTTNTQNFYFE